MKFFRTPPILLRFIRKYFIIFATLSPHAHFVSNLRVESPIAAWDISLTLLIHWFYILLAMVVGEILFKFSVFRISG